MLSADAVKLFLSPYSSVPAGTTQATRAATPAMYMQGGTLLFDPLDSALTQLQQQEVKWGREEEEEDKRGYKSCSPSLLLVNILPVFEDWEKGLEICDGGKGINKW